MFVGMWWEHEADDQSRNGGINRGFLSSPVGVRCSTVVCGSSDRSLMVDPLS